MVLGSGILCGSTYLLAQTQELHHFHSSLRLLERSSQEMCHLCTLLWYIINPVKRATLLRDDDALQEHLQSFS